MMTIRNLLQHAAHFLMTNAVEDAAFDAKEIVLSAYGADRSSLSLILDQAANENVCFAVDAMLQERINGVPLQYVIGEWDFYGNTFNICPGVLIPRPETEELTDIAIQYIKNNSCKIVYDVCAGSGCIGLSVAIACPQTEVFLFELYEKPLQCISRNVEKFGLKNVHIIHCDVLLSVENSIPVADVIISNPPYIPQTELGGLQKEVMQEPLTALDGGEDGLVFYRALSEHWFGKLKDGGRMYFECAENQPQAIVDLFCLQNNQIESAYGMKDFYGLDRFVTIIKGKDC